MWAQDHSSEFTLADMNNSEAAMVSTQNYLSWSIREGFVNLDLVSLIDRLELFLQTKNNKIDGMFCNCCETFYKFSDSNQEDGSFICYTCRSNPY